MTAQKGIEMLIYISDDGSPTGNFNLIGGMRATSIKLNSGTIDVTSAEHQDRWRRMITGGIRSIQITGEGVFNDDTAFGDMIDNHMTAATEALARMRFVIPDFKQFEADFHIPEIEFQGDHDGAVTFSTTFESAAEPTITDL